MTEGQIENSEWRWVFISSGLLILLTLLPYLWAYSVAVPNHRFVGILANPLDGNTYFAKMQQGFRGNWFFHLTYTPEDHAPVFLLTFYLFLGHLARWLASPLSLVFHTVRVLGSLFMLLMLYIFAADWTDDVLQRRVTWGLAAVGSGFGWLVVFTGHLTPDLTVPEAYLLYAAYTNAHFPWAIALIIYVAHTLSRAMLDADRGLPRFDTITIGLVTAALVLTVVQPFALVPFGLGVGVFLIWRWVRRRRFPRHEFSWALVVLLISLPYILYVLWAVSGANPVFQAWNAQNVTPSPPPWDYLLAYGLLIVFAALAIWKTWPSLGNGERDGDILLLGWLVANALILYAPINLQRRFSIGLIIPLAIFAARGLVRVVLPTLRTRWRPIAIAAAFVLVAPSTVLVLVLPLPSTLNHDERFYVSQAEHAALDWLSSQASESDVVLASPSYSLFVPAQTETRVVYGHPFETVNAEQRLANVLGFYEGSRCQLLTDEGVDYVVYGPREHALGGGCQPQSEPVYDSNGITIYRIGD